ncbi:gliding motility lipoprotein GldH [Pseudotenacibaculum sp. MALMAid0570]|uniref:gliding motility lipoprotein GldH n=1 Tax=Pseudotenacibaculum sp. MALMAid0570 TaxID=3143938 RepID=UPI0032E04049
MGIEIKRNRTLIYLFALLITFVSCDSNRVYDQYVAVEGNSWSQENPIEFEFQIKDTLLRNNLYINIRNNQDYAYSNLFLITHLNFPDGKKIVDTLEYEMADKTGRFLGSGLSGIKESKLFYKERSIFPSSGDYKLAIYQAMRKNGDPEGLKSLEGVTDVGFRIEKIE